MSTPLPSSTARLLRLVAVLALTVTGCGSDDTDRESSDASPTTARDRTTTTEASATTAEPAETTTTSTTAPETTVPTTRPRAVKQWTALRAGDCLVTMPTATFTTVDTIDCSEPHAAEFVGDRLTMGDGAATCNQVFNLYTGTTPEATGSAITWIESVPGEGLDINAGRVFCIAAPVDGSTATGSLKKA